MRPDQPYLSPRWPEDELLRLSQSSTCFIAKQAQPGGGHRLPRFLWIANSGELGAHPPRFFFSTPRALVYSINNLNTVQKGELILFQCLINTYTIQFNSDLFVQNLFLYAGCGSAHL